MSGKGLLVVTGAASGIGASIVDALEQAGREVLGLDRAYEAAAATSHRWPLDVGDDAAIRRVFQRIDEERLTIVGWVNCAGIAVLQSCLELAPETFRRTFEVNVFGPFLCTQLAALRMSRSGGGRVVNVASIAAFRAAAQRVAYGPSKSALVALTRQFAAELAADGIQVNAVAPGPIETAMSRALHGPSVRRAYIEHVPARRYGTPEEVADVVRYLLLDAPDFLTGEVIAVDGGYLCAGMAATDAAAAPARDAADYLPNFQLQETR